MIIKGKSFFSFPTVLFRSFLWLILFLIDALARRNMYCFRSCFQSALYREFFQSLDEKGFEVESGKHAEFLLFHNTKNVVWTTTPKQRESFGLSPELSAQDMIPITVSKSRSEAF